MIAPEQVAAAPFCGVDLRHTLSAEEVAEIVASLPEIHGVPDIRTLAALRSRIPSPLHTLGRRIAHHLDAGPGLLILDGLGLARLSDDQLAAMHVCIALSMGSPMPQNAQKDRVVIVRDQRLREPGLARGLSTNERMLLHTDGWDVLGLACLGAAESGGVSLFANAEAVRARLASEAPDTLALYAEPWDWNVRTLSGNPFAAPLSSPIFSQHGDSWRCRYGSSMLRSAGDQTGIPLSAARLQALDRFEKVAHQAGIMLRHRLRRGQSVWLNNYRILHGREAFVDGPGAGDTRHLVRLWVALPDAPVLAPDFADFDSRVFGCSRETGAIEARV